jgi:hypothetical protein
LTPAYLAALLVGLSDASRLRAEVTSEQAAAARRAPTVEGDAADLSHFTTLRVTHL